MKFPLLTLSIAAILAAGVAQAQAAGPPPGTPAPIGKKCITINRARICPARAVNAPGHAVKLLNGHLGGAGTHAVRCDATHPQVVAQVGRTVTVRACGRNHVWRMWLPPHGAVPPA